jgi:hypothetical protein
VTVLTARRIPVAPFLLAAALVAWLVTIERMRGMDAGLERTSAASAGTSGSG